MIARVRRPLRRIRAAGPALVVSLSFVGGVGLLTAGLVAGPDYGRGGPGDEMAGVTCPPKAVSHERPAEGDALLLAGLLDAPTCDDGGCSGCSTPTTTSTTTTQPPTTTTTTPDDDEGCTACNGGGATTTTQPTDGDPDDDGGSGGGGTGRSGGSETGSDRSSGNSSDGSSSDGDGGGGSGPDGAAGGESDDGGAPASDDGSGSATSESSRTADGHGGRSSAATRGSNSGADATALARRAHGAEHVALRGIPGVRAELDANHLRALILAWTIAHGLAAVALGYRRLLRHM